MVITLMTLMLVFLHGNGNDDFDDCLFTSNASQDYNDNSDDNDGGNITSASPIGVFIGR